MSFCKVAECRFPTTHVTKGHKCGPCGEYGHGEIECIYNTNLKNKLIEYYNDILPIEKQCTVPGCTEKELHTIEAHHCPQCEERNPHTIDNCPFFVKCIECPNCKYVHRNTNLQKIFCESECKICLSENIQSKLPCGHCFCNKCINKIKKTKKFDVR
jgi:hypothetical protein